MDIRRGWCGGEVERGWCCVYGCCGGTESRGKQIPVRASPSSSTTGCRVKGASQHLQGHSDSQADAIGATPTLGCFVNAGGTRCSTWVVPARACPVPVPPLRSSHLACEHDPPLHIDDADRRLLCHGRTDSELWLCHVEHGPVSVALSHEPAIQTGRTNKLVARTTYQSQHKAARHNKYEMGGSLVAFATSMLRSNSMVKTYLYNKEITSTE